MHRMAFPVAHTSDLSIQHQALLPASRPPPAFASSDLLNHEMATFTELFAGPEYGKVVILDGGMGTTLQVSLINPFTSSPPDS